MKAVLFPRSFYDLPGVAELSSAQKFFIGGICLSANACGIAVLTDHKCTTLGFLPSIARQLAAELAARGLVVFDEHTREVFVTHWFFWHKTPAVSSQWGKQVVGVRERIMSPQLKDEVTKAIESAPAAKIESVLVPLNILTSLRHPAPGKKWEATPQMLLLALYTWPTMSSAGLCVLDYDGLASYISASSVDQIIGHLSDLDAAGVVVFDYVTGEIFLPARLKNARLDWHLKEIINARAECVSHRIKTNFSKAFKRSFGDLPIKSDGCRLVEFSLLNKNSSKQARTAAAAAATADDETQKKGDERFAEINEGRLRKRKRAA